MSTGLGFGVKGGGEEAKTIDVRVPLYAGKPVIMAAGLSRWGLAEVWGKHHGKNELTTTSTVSMSSFPRSLRFTTKSA